MVDAIASGLRPFLTKDGADRVEAQRRGLCVHPMLNVGAHDARGKLRAQGQFLSAFVLE